MSFVHRSLAVGAVTLLLASASSAALAAPEYPPAGGGEVSVGTTVPRVGEAVPFSARFYLPLTDVDIRVIYFGAQGVNLALGGGLRGAALVPAAPSGACETGSTCTVVSDGDGVATADVTFTEPGKTTVEFAGTGADGKPLVQSTTVDVGGDTTGDGGDDAPDDTTDPDEGGILSNTGANGLIETGVVGLGLLGVGGLLVLAVRRRRDATNLA